MPKRLRPEGIANDEWTYVVERAVMFRRMRREGRREAPILRPLGIRDDEWKKALDLAHYGRDPHGRAAASADWNRRNRSRRLATLRRWYAANREELRSRSRDRWAKVSPESRQRQRRHTAEWQLRNREKLRASERQRYAVDIDRMRAKGRDREARRRLAKKNEITPAKWERIATTLKNLKRKKKTK